VFHPTRVAVWKGKSDGGPPTSLHRVDKDTLDIRAELSRDEIAADWIAHTFVGARGGAVEGLTFEYTGQFSGDDVVQTISVYNQQTRSWDRIDHRKMAARGDITITVAIADPHKYISDEGDLSVRFESQHGSENFAQWTNAVAWRLTRKH
jgi:hypothetical protein